MVMNAPLMLSMLLIVRLSIALLYTDRVMSPLSSTLNLEKGEIPCDITAGSYYVTTLFIVSR